MMSSMTQRGRLGAFLASIWHGAGDRYVYARDHWFDPSTRHAVRERLRLMGPGNLTKADVLDPQFGRPLSEILVVREDDLFPVGHSIQRPPWEVDPNQEVDPFDLAETCHARHGVWPISFSFPGTPLDVPTGPRELVARIVPGLPYSFEDSKEYMGAYHDAYFGLTHRKAGWDCFRHVEILASGAIPLMLDARDIPEFSMVHYPKRTLVEVADRAMESGAPPGEVTRAGVRRWFDTYLTSAAMAGYVLGAAGLEGSKRVLFVDEALPGFADYQSALTLLGLKQLMGRDCHVMHPVDYVYDDTAVDTGSLYGRGFGYTRILDGGVRSSTELGAAIDLESFDALVVGSISRNLELAKDLLTRFPVQRTVWVHGEDGAPTMDETRWMKSTGTHLFVRAIHTGGQ